ncbi:AraC family transcriptional regulator [Achromobacter aloeverae]|uniref:AraC family transcriptional regulator n=1 Tax=Achromobacter aloeverae TaxID=1750518 RepID=A0A4Q1HNY1_9BURK|nr:helix-turn-helix transcriptional regulator [Achromobacter aloeverae]RXN92752.1 AraC family transcriptional regulator [Achromobacter aloeverae]
MSARPPAHAPWRSIDADDYQRVPRPVTAMAKEFDARFNTGPHTHARAQLIYAAEGVMRVTTAQGVWALPALRALWVPPGVEHAVDMISPVSMRTLYLDGSIAGRLWAQCCVIEVSGLLRELVLALAREPIEYPLDGRCGQIASLIPAELAVAKVLPIRIPWPADRRLQAVCRAILEDPGSPRTVHEWGDAVGASGRTLIRLFQSELGLNYRQWVQQVRLADAVGRLALGQPVARIAVELGYRSPSAFAAMFRRAMGSPPNLYLLPGRSQGK